MKKKPQRVVDLMRNPVKTNYHHQSYFIPIAALNAVWQEVSREPRIQHRMIAERIGKSPSLVWATLQLLARMGHIRLDEKVRARAIEKPKYVVKENYFDD